MAFERDLNAFEQRVSKAAREKEINTLTVMVTRTSTPNRGVARAATPTIVSLPSG